MSVMMSTMVDDEYLVRNFFIHLSDLNLLNLFTYLHVS